MRHVRMRCSRQICDLNEERAQAAADQVWRGEGVHGLPRAAADPAIDAVSICTWKTACGDHHRGARSRQACPVREAALPKTVEDAERVQRRYKSRASLLQVGFVRRYAGSVEVLKRFIDAGDLGEIYYAQGFLPAQTWQSRRLVLG